MLMDIFSSFDPALHYSYNFFGTTMFWASSMFSLMLMTMTYWTNPTRLSFLTHSPLSFMNTQTSRTTGHNMKGFTSMVSALFLMLVLLNLSGLLPYTFSVTSHLIFTLSFALPIWTALIMSSVSTNPTKFLGALLPGGAPDWLNPFLVLIETISTCVRPFTLSFRLAANMSAGHIVLTLMGVYTSSALFSSLPVFITLLMTQMGYMLFEVAICLIQAYIFTLLLSLYSDDHV